MGSNFAVLTDENVKKALEAYQPGDEPGPGIIQQTIADAWMGTFVYYFFTEDAYMDLRQSVIDFVCEHRPGTNPRLGSPYNFGSYNFNIEIIFDDGIVLFKFPVPGVVVYPDDKIKAEVATMRYVADHTTIPVPHIYHWGTAAENPTRLHVPFIIMEHIPHATTIGQALEDPDFKIPSIPESEKREYLYQKMAEISLQLYNLTSDKIGSLGILDNGEYAVTSAPLPHITVDQVINCSVPVTVLPPRDRVYSSSTDYLTDAANMHIAGLLFMNEKFIESPTDCRNKFEVRCLVRNAVRRRQETQTKPPREIFRLWGDDLRPEDVLLDESGAVVGVIDWEYTYSAPETYYSNPPWWLLLEAMDQHKSKSADSDADPSPSDQRESSCDAENAGKMGSVDKFQEDWDEVVRTYLRALEKAEQKLQSSHEVRTPGNHLCSSASKDEAVTIINAPTLPLSQLVRHRWDEDTKEFALTTSIAQGFLFDKYFWDYIDKAHGVENAMGGYLGRVDLLDAPSRMLMDWFVHRRVEESQAWDPKALLDQVLEQMDGKSSVLFVRDDSREEDWILVY